MRVNVARTLAVAGLELRATLRDPLLWGLALAAAFATLAINPAAMIPSGDAAVGGVQPFANSRHALAQIFALTGLLFYTFPVALLAGRAVARDDEAKLGELLHTTPLTPGEYAAGKLAGVLGALGLLVLVHFALAVGWGEAGALLGSDRVHGPFHLAHYLGAALVFLVPGIVFTAGLAFAMGTVTRGSLAVYGLAIALFVFALGGLVPRPASAADGLLEPLFAIVDPWGARWLSREVFGIDRGIAFYNHSPIPFDGAFAINRLFVLAVPVAAFALAVRRLRRAVRGTATMRRSRRAASSAEPPATPTFAPLGNLAMTARPPGFLAATWAIARAELVELKSQPGPYLFVAFAAALVAESAGSTRGIYDSVPIATAGSLAVGSIEILTSVGCLLLLFQLVDSFDRARRLGLEPFLATAPVPTAALVTGLQLASAALLAGVLLAATVIALLYLAFQGSSPVEVGPFAFVWSLTLAPTFLVWGAFVSVLYGAVRRRSAAYALGLAALAGTAAALLFGSLTWLTNWPLWGALRWSDLGAFEIHGRPLALNRALMTALALLLGLLAVRLFPRRAGDRANHRSGRRSLHRSRWMRRLVVVLSVAVLAPAIELGQEVHRGFEGPYARERAREYRRLNLEAWRDVTPPELLHVDARLDLHPEEGAVDVEGTFTMANDEAAWLDRLAFTVGLELGTVEWTLDGAPLEAEDRSGLQVLVPRVPLPPGQGFEVGFRYRAWVPWGSTRNGGEVEQFIRPSGVVLDTLGTSFLPVPGFVDGIGVELPFQIEPRPEPRPTPPGFWHAELPPVAGGPPFTSRLAITAPAELTVNGVGRKTSERVSGDRRTVVWESGHPVRFLNVVAGRWVARRKGAAAVFHHPGHDYNVEEMLAALEASHRRYSEWFGPYPWPELKLSEHPDHVTRAKGFPTNIPFSEGMGFLTRSHDWNQGVPGLPTLVTAHEAAHQWWAHLLTPGRGPGADLLLEGMAHYSTLLLLEAEHGPEARRDFARGLEARYADLRRVDTERPLTAIVDTVRPGDETAIYDKGAWVLWMLDRQLGREAMLAGLRSLIRRFDGSRDHPAVPDLVDELRLRASDPQAFQAFVEQWLDGVVMPEIQLRQVAVTRAGGGWRVVATVENVGTGVVTVDVAVLAAEAGRRELFPLRLAPGEPAKLDVVVPFVPDRVVVDPDVELFQLHRARAERRVAMPIE